MKISNKVFGFCILIGWICILLIKPISDKIDDLTSLQPWFDAEIVLYREGELIKVKYTKWINRHMSAEPWHGWLEYPNKNNVWQKECSGSGNDSYDPSKSGTVYYTIEYFTGSNKECKTEHEVFRVCADWAMYDRNGRKKFFGPICSLPYNTKK